MGSLFKTYKTFTVRLKDCFTYNKVNLATGRNFEKMADHLST